MPKELKIRGIVIREAPMGDKDKRVVLLTEEVGKISVLAKGAMGPKSKYAALTQLFSLVELVVTKGRTFYYIKEGRLIESFYDLRLSLERLSYAALMAEVADTLCLDGQENKNLLTLLYRALKKEMTQEEGKESLPADVFLLRALADNGFYPSLDECFLCGRSFLDDAEFGADEKALFDPGQGGAACRACRHGGIELSRGALKAMRYICRTPYQSLFNFTVDDRVLRELDTAVVEYLKEQTERTYQGLEFLNKVKNAP